jgi:putative effector of murein hydrolase LrgA (UPF0299 family)
VVEQVGSKKKLSIYYVFVVFSTWLDTLVPSTLSGGGQLGLLLYDFWLLWLLDCRSVALLAIAVSMNCCVGFLFFFFC